MPEESWDDRHNRAVGLPTAAQAAQRAAEEGRERQKILESQPRWDGLIRDFNGCGSVITDVFNKRVATYKTAGINISQPNFVGSTANPITGALAENSIHCSLRPDGLMHGPNIPPLVFALHPDGKVKIDIHRAASAPQYQHIAFTPRVVDLPAFKTEQIEQAFLDYVTAVHGLVPERLRVRPD
jgi:hypothetical protein